MFKKKLLFFAHGNNDLDHFLPIMCSKKKKFKVLLFYIPDLNSSNISKLHISILRENNIEIIYFKNIVRSYLLVMLYNVQIILKNIKFFLIKKNFHLFLINYIIFFFEKLINFFILSSKLKKFFKKYLLRQSVNLIVVDTMRINNRNISNIFLKFLNSVLSSAEILKIPIFMISHGLKIIYKTNNDDIPTKHNLRRVDNLALCNKYEVSSFKNLVKNKNSISVLGDSRYDSSWIKMLKKKNFLQIKLFKKNKKKKILYVMGNLNFLEDDKIHQKINSEILGLTSQFKDIELWIKIHPRQNLSFSLKKHKDIKIFGNDVDTSILIDSCDILITTFSGVAFHAMLSKKPSILYYSWKDNIKNSWTIFDKTNVIEKVYSFEDLKKKIKLLIGKSKLNCRIKNNLFHELIYGEKKSRGLIVDKYLSKIHNIINEKK